MTNDDPDWCICGEPLDDGLWFCSRDCEEQYHDEIFLSTVQNTPQYVQLELFDGVLVK